MDSVLFTMLFLPGRGAFHSKKISYTFGKNPFVFKKNPSKIRINPFVLEKSRTLFPMSEVPLDLTHIVVVNFDLVLIAS